MTRSLADGHEKIAILFEEPADPASPTLLELNGGIEAAPTILMSDWAFGPTASATVAERAVADEIDPSVPTLGAYEFGATIFRHWSQSHIADIAADVLFQGLKIKGTRFWAYGRMTSKMSADPWAETDEIFLGAEILSDTPTQLRGGYIKNRVNGFVQRAWPYITPDA